VVAEEDPHRPAGDRDEEREARGEPVFPGLLEAEPGVPGKGGLGVRCAQERRDLLIHHASLAQLETACRIGFVRRSHPDGGSFSRQIHHAAVNSKSLKVIAREWMTGPSSQW